MTWATTHQPCPACSSSDAYAVNEEGWGTCFACHARIPPDGEPRQVECGDFLSIEEYIPLTRRGVAQETCRRYGYGIASFKGGKVQVANFRDDKGKLVGQKVRLPNKDFFALGKTSDRIWGLDQARPGGKLYVITEGEIDRLVTSEAMGENWPVGSLPSGTGSAVKAIQANLEKLETYERVILAFDDDEPGREATDKCVELFSPGKVFIARFGGHKDPDDMRRETGNKALRDAIWGGTPWRPDGVVNFAEIKERVRKPARMGTAWPWPQVNGMTYGMRSQEIVTVVAATGGGKTTVVAELAYHLLKTESKKLGLLFLEEGVERTGKRLVGVHLDRPIHLPDASYTDDEFDRAYHELFGSDRVYSYDHFGSLDPDILLSRMRYMVKSLGCEMIILDHISIVVSGSDLDVDERRLIDRTMTKLRSFSQETGVTIVVVCHLRRLSRDQGHEEGKQVSLSHLRGSGAIAQLSDTVIACERDQQAKDETARNVVTLRVLKCRYSGQTGPADMLEYVRDTGRLVVHFPDGEVAWGDDRRDY